MQIKKDKKYPYKTSILLKGSGETSSFAETKQQNKRTYTVEMPQKSENTTKKNTFILILHSSF